MIDVNTIFNFIDTMNKMKLMSLSGETSYISGLWGYWRKHKVGEIIKKWD